VTSDGQTLCTTPATHVERSKLLGSQLDRYRFSDSVSSTFHPRGIDLRTSHQSISSSSSAGQDAYKIDCAVETWHLLLWRLYNLKREKKIEHRTWRRDILRWDRWRSIIIRWVKCLLQRRTVVAKTLTLTPLVTIQTNPLRILGPSIFNRWMLCV